MGRAGHGVPEARSAGRGDADTVKRLRVWKETRDDLEEHDGFRFYLVLRTDVVAPEEAAKLIAAALEGAET